MTDKLRVGWLWCDNSPDTTLEQKIARAADAYERKFGRRPSVCCVHPDALKGELRVDGLVVTPLKTVLLHHFWLGVAGEAAPVPKLERFE